MRSPLKLESEREDGVTLIAGVSVFRVYLLLRTIRKTTVATITIAAIIRP